MSNVEGSSIERKAFIFNVQKYNMYDGPGVRTTRILQRLSAALQMVRQPGRSGAEDTRLCLRKTPASDCGALCGRLPGGDPRDHCRRASTGCAGILTVPAAENVNPYVLRLLWKSTGQVKTVSELLDICRGGQLHFTSMSGGGVTLGGGECTAQPEAARELLMACKSQGINTAIETCGHTKPDKLFAIAEYVDLFLFDIKHMDPKRHNELTGIGNELILSNLKELLTRRYNVKVRMPMLKGINDSKEEIDQVIQFLLPFRDDPNFKGVDLLPYHKMGVGKYGQLDKPYPIEGDPSLSQEDLDRIEGWMKAYDFPVTVVRH